MKARKKMQHNVLVAEVGNELLLNFVLTCFKFSPNYVDPPVGWGSTYCFTDVGVRVRVGVSVTPITKAPPAQIFFGRHVFCSPGHELLISAMTLTFALKVKP